MEKYRTESEQVELYRSLTALRASCDESIEISGVLPEVKAKVQAILADFCEDVRRSVDNREGIYDITASALNRLIDALHIVKRENEQKEEERQLYLALRYSLWERVYKIKGWQWPTERINELPGLK